MAHLGTLGFPKMEGLRWENNPCRPLHPHTKSKFKLCPQMAAGHPLFHSEIKLPAAGKSQRHTCAGFCYPRSTCLDER